MCIKLNKYLYISSKLGSDIKIFSTTGLITLKERVIWGDDLVQKKRRRRERGKRETGGTEALRRALGEM
jgi:hypothetical protein